MDSMLQILFLLYNNTNLYYFTLNTPNAEGWNNYVRLMETKELMKVN